MANSPKSQRWRIGDVISIPMGRDGYCFGRVLERPLVAFYDLKSPEIPPTDDIVSSHVLFSVWVMKYAITSWRWQITGRRELDGRLLEPPTFFKQDPINKKLSLYFADGTERAATRREIEGLERAAAWDPEHVEDRLRDHFAGVPNKWVESLKPE